MRGLPTRCCCDTTGRINDARLPVRGAADLSAAMVDGALRERVVELVGAENVETILEREPTLEEAYVNILK